VPSIAYRRSALRGFTAPRPGATTARNGEYASGTPLEDLLDHIPVGIVLVRASSGLIGYANRRAEEILGRTLFDVDEPVSHRELVARRPDGTKVTPERLVTTRVLRGHGRVREDLVWVRPDGTMVETRATAAPVYDEDARLISVVLTLDDAG
jgi:PAS domain S-box-containing protein